MPNFTWTSFLPPLLKKQSIPSPLEWALLKFLWQSNNALLNDAIAAYKHYTWKMLIQALLIKVIVAYTLYTCIKQAS